MKQIHICYMINEAYLPLTLESIGHVKRSFRSKEHELNIHIVGIEEFTVPDDITFTLTSYRTLPILWQRVYIPEMIGVDRVIFMDSDTITTTCISKLWDIDLGENVIGAVQHLQCTTFGELVNNWKAMDREPFNKHEEKEYFNCGVMLIDCQRWIEGNYPEKCLEAIKMYNNTQYKGYDEPGFNLVLIDKWQKLDKRWNYIPLPQKDRIIPYILHYYGEYPAGTPRHNMF
jgi:lipopolysaccharide biosynthesis glycosyltransferase